ncbi:cryptochrome/photolyase family protein [Mycolicibacter icosiumassiliensis]|uniref:cryptochrome/photolyase family protein n=1 Tax=Mycolicibacter icosiumassiliensis TaxID=1792835 RepID=UPI00082BD249|nr:deoxyribodipyrimidine photo-lyase [Mycolicibacter icosiumassiliensis]
MPVLLWYRRDLRVGDLPSLSAALAEDPEVLCCFVLDPQLEASAGRPRLQFLGQCLRNLRDDLGGRLLVTRGLPQQRIPRIAAAIGASAVHVSEDFAPFGRRRDASVRATLGDIPLVATGSPYLVSPGRVVKDDGAPYRVFTPFFRRWREHGWRRPVHSRPASAHWIDPFALSNEIAQPVEIPDFGGRLELPAGEGAALEHWKAFVGSGLERYEQDRDRPDGSAGSRMSAYLKFGNIHPRTMAADLDPQDPGSAAYLRQLAFRDFYAAVLHFWPRSAWANWNRGFDSIQTDTDAEARRLFERWKAGETGFPIVDAGMRELRATGFMPNRVRMIVASFLVKDLHLPWQWGARWFLDQLVDGDVANNQHGWQWCAGCGTDAAPYFRVFNPTLQGRTFDPDGAYVRRWVPELADVADPHLVGASPPPGYPEPMVDHRQERSEALRRYQRISG